jgi:hypothetical protein
MDLGYKCKSYLSLRSNIGGEDLSSPVGVAANDVSWSLVLAYLSAWTMTLKRMRLTNNISGVGSVAGKDGSIGAWGGSTSNLGSSLPDDLGKVTGSRAVSWLAEVVKSYLSAFSPIQFNGRRTILVGPWVESFLDIVTTSNTSSDVLSVRSSAIH